jgi:hypothetical protein
MAEYLINVIGVDVNYLPQGNLQMNSLGVIASAFLNAHEDLVASEHIYKFMIKLVQHGVNIYAGDVRES